MAVDAGVQSVLERYGLELRGAGSRGSGLLTDQGVCEVRRYPGVWEELCFVADALAYVESRGFTRLRRLRRTTSGEPGVRVGTGLFYVVEGESGPRLVTGRQGDLQRAAALIAEFHQAGEGYPASGGPERDRTRHWPAALQDRYAELGNLRAEAARSRGDFARLYGEFADDFLEQADRALTGLQAVPAEQLARECFVRRRLAHRRFTPGLVRRVGPDVVIDGWDHLGLDLPVLDLARFLQRGAGNDPDQAYYFLEAYNEVVPVEEPEWEMLLAWLRFPHAFWRLGHLHFRRKETHRSRLARVVRHEVEREVFVETLALQWAARKLAPVPVSVARPIRSEPKETEEDEREGNPVTKREELVGFGFLAGGEETAFPGQLPPAGECLPRMMPDLELERLPEILPELERLPEWERLPEILPELERLPEMMGVMMPDMLPECLPEMPEGVLEMMPEAAQEAFPASCPAPPSEVYLEVVPEPCPEVLPEVVPEPCPEVLPEVVPEPCPEPLPEVCPEVEALEEIQLTEELPPSRLPVSGLPVEAEVRVEEETVRVIVWRSFPAPLSSR